MLEYAISYLMQKVPQLPDHFPHCFEARLGIFFRGVSNVFKLIPVFECTCLPMFFFPLYAHCTTRSFKICKLLPELIKKNYVPILADLISDE